MIAIPTSARIHILVAQDAPVAVIFRRGPSKQVCSILWDLKTNKFKLGQWLKGRIYERRSHISPDGKHMIYFAMNGKWESETRGAWTAISKPLYLKALTLYAKGDCWNGGGLFIDNNSYLLNEKYKDHELLHDNSGLVGERGLPKDVLYGNNECLGIYYVRLQNEDWKLNQELSNLDMQVFDKQWNKTIFLRKFTHIGSGDQAGRGVYWDSHAIFTSEGRLMDCPNWEWADIIKGKLYWAEAGKLCLLESLCCIDPEHPKVHPKIIQDFNSMTPEAIEAPY